MHNYYDPATFGVATRWPSPSESKTHSRPVQSSVAHRLLSRRERALDRLEGGGRDRGADHPDRETAVTLVLPLRPRPTTSDVSWLNKLEALRQPGEGLSETIIRFLAMDAGGRPRRRAAELFGAKTRSAPRGA